MEPEGIFRLLIDKASYTLTQKENGSWSYLLMREKATPIKPQKKHARPYDDAITFLSCFSFSN